MTETQTNKVNPWPHRLAVLLVCATFPLIFVGGLVTTSDAGMAVPDWPTTYGYNMFAYPLETWLYGPWDLFVEHEHRLLGAAVGMLTIAVAFVTWRREPRRWVCYLSWIALGLVILQGLLGGLRVVHNERQLAKVHACVGPLFFAVTVALAVVTSRIWRQAEAVSPVRRQADLVRRFAVWTLLLSYLQLVLGAHVRHITADATPGTYRTLIFVHLFLAAAVLVHVLLLGTLVVIFGAGPALVRPSVILCLLLCVQVVLGGATWVVKFGWPAWFSESLFAARYVVKEKSMLQTNIVTAHVAVGSLIVGIATQLTLRSLRLLRPMTTPAKSAMAWKGVVA